MCGITRKLLPLFVTLAALTVSVVAQTPTQRLASNEVQIVAAEMCCKGCAQKISRQLYKVKGVSGVKVNVADRTVTVTLPQQDPIRLGALWQAIQSADGGPTSLQTGSAYYKLSVLSSQEDAEQARQLGATERIVIENLDCQGCAQKIASQLYALKGVTKVGVDLNNQTMVVESQGPAPISPWQAIEAVAKANERAVAVSGSFGTLAVEYSAAAAPKNHQASQTSNGGIQR